MIYSVLASGGTPVPATVFEESQGEVSHALPQFLPDGRRFLFLVLTAAEGPDTDGGFAVFAGSLGSTEKARIVATHSIARYASSGHLLFLRDRTLVAQPFDPDTLELSGDAVPIGENLAWDYWTDTMFSVSDTGLLLFQAGAGEESRLVWLDRDGREQGTAGESAFYNTAALSHDEKRLAVAIRDPQKQRDDIRILDIEQGGSTRLTLDPSNNRWPLWSDDDRTIYFISDRSGTGGIYSRSSSGSGTDELVYGEVGQAGLFSISPDGTTAWFVRNDARAKTGFDINRVDLESQEAEALRQTPSQDYAPAISPDGHWLLYDSNESGRRELYVQSLRDDGGRWQISTNGGVFGQWTRGQREIVFRALDGDQRLMAVEVTLEPTFSSGIPEALSERVIGRWPPFIVTSDGRRFIVPLPIEEPGSEPLTLVQNWTSELER